MPDNAPAAGTGRGPGQDFIRTIVADDLASGRHATIVTRFPPEPNGFLHIGHAKAICLNFGLAAEVAGGRCHLRFDDTNPETEDIRYVEAIEEDVRWLGFDWGEHLYFASDYFELMYTYAEELIGKGLAYVDSQSEEEIRAHRGTVTEPGTPSPYRERSAEENLDLFRRMRAGEFPNGAHVLRAKIDMGARNMLMRDPLLYRIRHAHHYRTGDTWCIYPLYDYAHPLEDAIEHVTHSLCTLEFENNRELYDWLVANTSVPSRPQQIEFARLNLDYTVMSKRKLLQLVRDHHVAGWDDPRMPTIAGLRRRGVTPEAIRTFCDLIGVARADSRVDIAKLEYAIRADLNTRAPRVLCVLDPLKVVITNWPESAVEPFDAPYWPHDVPNEGTRPLPFTRELFIERDDFAEEPPPGFRRLAPGREVRLRYAYIIRCDEVVKDPESGEIVELRCSYDPATRGGQARSDRAVKGTIHWVSASHGLPCEVRLYDRLFAVPDPDAAAAESGEDFRAFLNPASLVVRSEARIEPSVRDWPAGTRWQFERLGFFCSDIADSRPDALVFNRTVTLKDTWAKQVVLDTARVAARAHPVTAHTAGDELGRPDRGKRRPATPAAEPAATASPLEIVMRAPDTTKLFEDAVAAGADAQSAANWIVNELPRAGEGQPVAELAITGAGLVELLELLRTGEISTSAAKEVLADMVKSGASAASIVERRGLRQLSDEAALAPVVDEVLAAHPDKVAEYRAGRTGLLGFFVGQIMRKTGGRANPERVQALVTARL
jgi:glutaminyl-tRNA synthetase